MVEAARPSVRAIARSDRPLAFRPASRSLSSAESWAYPDMAAPLSVWRQMDTSSINGRAPHPGPHPDPPDERLRPVEGDGRGVGTGRLARRGLGLGRAL